jgi:CBS domain-containing protein
VSRKGAPIGILTERDMINRVLSKNKNPKKTKSKDVMTTPIVSKPSNFPLYKLIKIMNEYMIRHVPIIQEDKIIGIITQTDIVKFTEKSSNIKYMIQYLTIVILLLLLIFMR